MKLVIVESPTKAKTISKYLGKSYQVESSFGHVRDLPKSKLGVDPEKNFEPTYIIPTKARKNLTLLKKAAQKSTAIILATDEDREGEAIAWHLSQALGLGDPKSKKANPKPVERIVFHEITKEAIINALNHSRRIDLNMVDAQQARRVLDRLVGYKLSPFLWKKIAKGLSAGRVQSVAVRLIVERENEIRKFKPEEYWTIAAELKAAASDSFTANLVEINHQTLKKFDIKTQDRAAAIAESIAGKNARVVKIEKKKTVRKPAPPFITSTLQRTAANRLGYSSKKTMFLAQQLYEKGLITYMRTDSVNLSNESLTAAKSWLQSSLGDQYAAAAPRVYRSKSRLAQEAHEAIRPTDISKTPETVAIKEAAEKKIYTLIWQSFVASQMPEAEFDATTIESEVKGEKEDYTLRANGNIMIFDGYLKVWPQNISENQLPDLTEQQLLAVQSVKPDQHFTEPPARYSEATLIKALEEHDIGRPSTYAPTLSTIQARNYVKKITGRLQPTEIGEMVDKVLVENFPDIVDIEFTAKMENDLDNIAAGKEAWQNVVGNFFKPFEANLEAKYETVEKKIFDEKTDETCEKCGKPMIIKFGRFGKFLACTGFPDCRSTKNLGGQGQAPKLTGVKCEKCGEGELIERRVNRGRAKGKIFWGCNRYPKCDQATWENPIKNPVPTES